MDLKVDSSGSVTVVTSVNLLIMHELHSYEIKNAIVMQKQRKTNALINCSTKPYNNGH